MPSEAGKAVRQPDERWRRLLLNRQLWLGLFFSAGCLVLAMVGIDIGEMATALRSANPAWLAAAVLSVLLTNWAKSWRWWLLLYTTPRSADRTATRIGLGRLTTIWTAGAGANLASPVPRSGDVLRVYFAGGAGGISKSLVLGTIAAEKLLDTVLLAVCFLGLLLFVAVPQELEQRQAATLGVALALTLLVAALLWQRERLLALARTLLARVPRGAQAADSLAKALQGLEALRRPGRLLALSALTVAIGFLSVATAYLVFLALDMPPSWAQSLLLWVVLQVGVVIPSTPGKIGVFQVLCRWTLGLFGVAAAVGLAYGILLYLVAPLLLMILGALALAVEGWRAGRLPTDIDLALASLSGQDPAASRGP
jgi:hypothetical protein